MSLLLYGIADCRREAAALVPGVNGLPVTAIGDDGFVALVSECVDPLSFSREAAWAFDQVIDAQMPEHTVLPARLGSMFADASALQAVLRTRRDELTAGFERVRGAVELGVRATFTAAGDEPALVGAGTGTSYLLERVAGNKRIRCLASQLDLAVDDLARASRHRTHGGQDASLVAAYLVATANTDDFVARIRGLASRLDDAELVCTGPWPPYSFVEPQPLPHG